MTTTLRQRILAFVRDRAAGDFGSLALALFAEQYERFPDYREHCARQGVDPDSVSAWRDIPLGSAPDPVSTAPDPDFDLAIVSLALPELLGSGAAALVVEPGGKGSGAGGLGIGALLELVASQAPPDSFVSRNTGLDTRTLRSWLGARQRDRRAVRLMGSAAGLHGLLEFLVRRNLRFRLPPGSTAYRLIAADTVTDAVPSELLVERLGLAPDSCPRLVCPVSGTPLLEQPAATPRFPLPHWVRSVNRPGDSGAPATLLDLASTEAPAHRTAAGLGEPQRG